MNNKMTDAFWSLMGRLHLTAMGREMGMEMRGFLRNFFLMGIGTFASGLGIFALNVAGGRLLGPHEYGRYSVVMSLGTLFTAFMLLGFHTAVVRYLSAKKNAVGIMATALLTVVALIVVAAAVSWLFQKRLVPLLGTDPVVYRWAIVIGAVVSLHFLTRAFLQAQNRFKTQMKLDVGGAVVALGVFGILLSTGWRSFLVLLSAVASGYISFILVGQGVAGVWRDKICGQALKTLAPYGSVAFVGGLAGFFAGQVDRLIVNHYLGSVEAGIYNAYLTASIVLVGYMVQVFAGAFFPAASAAARPIQMLRTLDRATVFSSLVVLPLSFVTIWLTLKLFGNRYPYSHTLSFLCAVNASTFVAYQGYMWLLNSEGFKGARTTVAGGFSLSLLNFGLLVWLVPLYGLTGAVTAALITNTAYILYFRTMVVRVMG